MKAKKTKIRSRILRCFAGILVFPFLFIWIIFNITMTQYIRISAMNQLNRSFAAMSELALQTENDDILEGITLASALRIAHDIFSSNIFFVDQNYNLLFARNHSTGMLDILQLIQTKMITDLNLWQSQRLRIANRQYYVSTHRMANMLNPAERIYMVVYVDITSPMWLAHRVNVIMVILVGIIFALATFVVLFLSNSITRPIEKLCKFALNIGRGDFSVNDFEFKDMELDELNTALNKSVKQLTAYDSEQKTFFQNVSHELRTPLMSIKCYAEGITCGLMEPKGASKTILQETDRLSELVTELLYVSKIDNITTAYTSEKVNLVEVIRDCAARQQVVAEKAKISFSFRFDKDVIQYDCIRDLISRAVDNLISNAIRYAKSEVVLACHKTDDHIEIGVTDDGDGIAPDIVPHVFERFYKGSNGNFGIGLSIVKSITQQHAGHVAVENLAGGGAMFTMTLPT
ncbi:MAG: HAMP domain-containing histidine kinase [Treponema sp.]|nr:HAMP domain-containing histidine kinase [Treponema sp.]